MLWILMSHVSVLLHRVHLIHTYVGFDHLRCLTLTHHFSCSVIGSPPPPPAPPSLIPTLPSHWCWMICYFDIFQVEWLRMKGY